MQDEEEDDRESEEETESSEDSEEEEEEGKGNALTPIRFSAGISDIGLTGFEYHDLGPASLSVLQLDRSELVHMRHVMVKIELDSREVSDCVVTRVEAGRVCVVCHSTTPRFSLFTGPGLLCSVCRFSVCSQCTTRHSSPSLPSSPAPPSPSPTPSSPSSPSPSSPTSLTARLGKLFSTRRSSVDSPPEVLCRPCSQFVEQVVKVVFFHTSVGSLLSHSEIVRN